MNLRPIVAASSHATEDRRQPRQGQRRRRWLSGNARNHFSHVANAYRSVRTTDLEPILFINDQLDPTRNIVAADVGCGAGRYDELLFCVLGERLFLHCTDANAEMLGELETCLIDVGIDNFETHGALAADLPFAPENLDCILTFNACHYFDLPDFLASAHRTLKPGGSVFMYTRTRTQNGRSVWGVHFPSFSEKETRLYTDDEVISVLSQPSGMELTDLKRFRYDRAESLDRLIDLARIPHYSTFRLYSEDEFETALEQFARNVEANCKDPQRVTWCDENTMYVITRTD